MLEKYPTCAILYDGFSLPQDYAESSDEMISFYREMTSKDKSEIDGIILECISNNYKNENQYLHDASGLSVLDSIALAQTADTYFCHLGTIQHKIGWTANRSGMIHGNRTILASKPEVWHADALEFATQPAAIDRNLIEDITPGQKSGDYRAIECAAFAVYVTKYLDTCLASATQAEYR
jgi:hypothetical protein